MFSPNHKPIIDVFVGPTVSTTMEATTTTLSPAIPDTTLFPDTTTTPSPVETNNNTAYNYGQQTTTAQPYQYRTPATTTVANNVGYPTVPDVITTTTTPPVNENPQVNVPSTNESIPNAEQSNPIQVDETSENGSNDTSNTNENMYLATAVPAITSPQESVVTAHVTETVNASKQKGTSSQSNTSNQSNTFIFVYTLLYQFMIHSAYRTNAIMN